MWRDMMSKEGEIMQGVINLVNCTSSAAAAAAARTSESSHHSQIVGVQQLRHALAIICWVLGLPGKCCVNLNHFEYRYSCF